MHSICICISVRRMKKSERQTKIVAMIESEDLTRQDEIVERLSASGYTVTQASVSRDLDELGIVKVKSIYRMPNRTSAQGIFGLISLKEAGPNMIVARCASGLASAAAVRIDAGRIAEIVGTIAGDDTIFIAVGGAFEQRNAIKKIWELFSE